MARTKRKIVLPTPKEDAEIRAGIALDPDNPELTPEQIKEMRPAREVFPEIVEWYERNKGKKMPPAKEWVNIPIDYDILDHFRNAGPDWHKRLNDTLRQAVFGSEND